MRPTIEAAALTGGAAPAPVLTPAFLYERALTCAAMGAHEAAVAALQQALQAKPDFAAAAAKLAALTGKGVAAGSAGGKAGGHGKAMSAAKIERAEQAVRDLLGATPPAEAASLLRGHLMDAPTDFAAVRMLAQLALPSSQFTLMEQLLKRALDLAPTYLTARQNLAFVLVAQNKAVEAMMHIDRLLAHDRREAAYLSLRARALTSLGDYAGAITIFEKMLKDGTAQKAGFWLSYAHALKYVGRRADSVRAYRTCIGIAPTMGDAWWGLANIKTEILTEADRRAMAVHLERASLSAQDRAALHYALGHAWEQAGDYAESFRHYAEGAALKRAALGYDADRFSRDVAEARDFFTAARFADVAGSGCDDPAPIFIVGLPRAGSTLIEQIVASHSLVEGTRELPLIGALAGEIANGNAGYPEALASLSARDLAALGARYLEQSRIYRKQGTPYFIDKMPPNWLHAGFIHMILPRAKIIDVRRDAMASCFSAFKQLFAGGSDYSYGLADLGRFYGDYVGLMAHWDAVLPGTIHRVMYERLVDDTEAEIRRLLAYCGLPFEPACLRFWENKRAVGTPSAEQVRQPIFKDGLSQWRRFEPWLGDLRQALGVLAG